MSSTETDDVSSEDGTVELSLGSPPIGQMLLDATGRLLQADPGALQLTGLAASDLHRQPVWSTGAWVQGREGLLQRACAEAGRGRHVRFELNGTESETQAMDVSLDPIADDQGAVTHVLLVVRPAGEARRRQAALGAAETLMTMGRYATRMAHEINNPLASIKNSFLLVKEGLEPTHPYYRYVGAIDRELNRLTAISQQLYDVYRLSVAVDAGTTVAAIVGDVVDMLGQRFRSTPMDVALDPSVERTLPVPGLLLRQVVYTILLNALEIAPAAGEPVVVRGAVRDGKFVLTVHGPGAASPQDLLRRVTEPAWGARRYTATIDIGLDPTLFRHAAHAMGARLTADERTDGGDLRLEIPALAVA